MVRHRACLFLCWVVAATAFRAAAFWVGKLAACGRSPITPRPCCDGESGVNPPFALQTQTPPRLQSNRNLGMTLPKHSDHDTLSTHAILSHPSSLIVKHRAQPPHFIGPPALPSPFCVLISIDPPPDDGAFLYEEEVEGSSWLDSIHCQDRCLFGADLKMRRQQSRFHCTPFDTRFFLENMDRALFLLLSTYLCAHSRNTFLRHKGPVNVL